MQSGRIHYAFKSTLISSLREIDIRGWYHNCHTIGIIFKEVTTEQYAFISLIIQKIHDRFCNNPDPDWMNKIEISFHLFTETKSVCLLNATISSALLFSERCVILESNNLDEISVKSADLSEMRSL